ncbi:hypothetical protein MY10362_009835 [Beauveria mimosiformis]
MKFSKTLAILFMGLAAASPLIVRDPQGSRRQSQPNDLLLPSQGDDSEVIDPQFTPPVPPSRGPQNSQGFTQENCDNIRNNFNEGFAAQFGCGEFN